MKVGDLYEGRIGYHGNIQLKKSGGGWGGSRGEEGERRRQKA